MKMAKSDKKYIGSVLVVGGGVAGINAALQLANDGYYVYLVEKKPSLGGTMPQLSRTFGECFCCKIYPQAYSCLWNPNVEILTLSEVDNIEGELGNFTVTVNKRPRFVKEDKCIACGECVSVCPVDIKDSEDFQQNERKAVYSFHPFSVPMTYTIDPDTCLFLQDGSCGECSRACPVDAIDLEEKEQSKEISVGSVILSTGFKLYDPHQNPNFGYHLPNVLTCKELERLTSPMGPNKGQLLRPSDGKVPEKVAWLLCVGSRDIHKADNPHCSSVCCMYSLKEAYEMKKKLGEDFQGTIFLMDIRSFGKGCESYYNEAKDAGLNFVRCRIHTVDPSSNDDLEISYLDNNGEFQRDKFDMVVLATGMEVDDKCASLLEKCQIETAMGSFVDTSSFAPTKTSVPGIYVSGVLQGPKDIYESIMDARGAAGNISRLLSSARYTVAAKADQADMKDIADETPQIGIFFLAFPWCPLTQEELTDSEKYALGLPNVKVAIADRDQMGIARFLETMKESIAGKGLNRVVAVSSLPQLHEEAIKSVMLSAGLNPLTLEMVDLRDFGTCLPESRDAAATEKIKDLIRMAVTKANLVEPAERFSTPVTKSALVVGGGVAGMVSALSLAEDGFSVSLVEKSDKLGGNARLLNTTWKNEEISPHLDDLISRVGKNESISVYLNSEVKTVKGCAGNFESVVSTGNGDTETLNYGVAIVATGGQEYKPDEYLYGKNSSVMTLLELDEKLKNDAEELKGSKTAVFIQCVGSREPQRPYCSRVCCSHSVENALKLKELNPDMDIYVLYRELRTYGLREQLFLQARHEGIRFIRFSLDKKPTVNEQDGKLAVVVEDPIIGKDLEIETDIITLASAIVPTGNENLSQLFHLPLNDDGFFKETKDENLRFVGAKVEGVFFCGLCHNPKSIDETIAQAEAVASQAAAELRKDVITFRGEIAVVNPDLCAACCTCVRTCPYGIPFIGEERVSEIDPARCTGCGACVTECPGKAISLQNFTDKQIISQIDALLMA